MKRIAMPTTILTIAVALSSVMADNPVISHRSLADPNGFVFDDRIYAICSNDDDNVNGYDMKSAVVISTNDLMNWTDHGDVFRTTRDARWAAGSYAPTAIAAKGKVYMYFPNIASGVGVLIADRPEGPYKDPLNKALVSGSLCPMQWCFDPVIFVDDDADKSAYLMWGGGTPYGSNFRASALNSDMISLKGAVTTPNTPNSFEGPFIHKYKGNYYVHYPIQGNSNLEYSMSSTSPISGYTRKGVVLPNPTLNGQNINQGNNSHASIFEYKGSWYMMYHDRRLFKATYKRDVSIDKLEYESDGRMKQVVVTSGMAQLRNFDPYDSIPAATMSKQSGIKATFDASSWTNYLVPQNSGSWIRISAVDFRAGAKRFLVGAGTTGPDVKVEVRSGSENGPIAGTCPIANTGSKTRMQTSACDLTGLSGVKDLFLKFTGVSGNANFAWFRFEPLPTAVERDGAREVSAMASTTAFTIFDVNGHPVRRILTESGTDPRDAWVRHGRDLPVGTYLMRSGSGEVVRKFIRTEGSGAN
ncbi:MAG: family 43 glycosylhydrolase [Fibrobacteria bacterium]|nr:family 43 glycosylhydrolase [Fibrobacteria bacterium]